MKYSNPGSIHCKGCHGRATDVRSFTAGPVNSSPAVDVNPARSLLWVREQAHTAASPGLPELPAGPTRDKFVDYFKGFLVSIFRIQIPHILTG